MKYKNNELIIYCKYCHKKKKLRARQDIRLNGNFCNRLCFREWLEKNSLSKEERRKKWNKYYREYVRRKKWRNPEYRAKIKTRIKKRHIWFLIRVIKKFGKEKKNQERIKYKLEHRRIFLTEEERQEKRRLYRKEYKLRYPEKRSKSKGITKEAFEKIKAQYDYRCAICGRKEPFLDQYWIWLTQDHIIPRSKGGGKRSRENIQPLCWNCNCIGKRDKIDKGRQLI